jgi:hypothetical protein
MLDIDFRFYEEEDEEGRPHDRPCAVQGCPLRGEYPAPKTRNRADGLYWFCLEHVREYNQSWDYYQGMNDTAIEASRRDDVTWNRPSWPFSAQRVAEIRDALHRFRHGEYASFKRQAKAPPVKIPKKVQLALEVFELEAKGLNHTVLKKRYRYLVASYHPDTHNQDKIFEEKLKQINVAYGHLKNWLDAPSSVPYR